MNLFKAIDIFFKRASVELVQTGQKMSQKDKESFLNTLKKAYEKSKSENKSIGDMANLMLLLKSQYENFDYENFNPYFVKSFFDEDDQTMWEELEFFSQYKDIDSLPENIKDYGEQVLHYMSESLAEVALDSSKVFGNPAQWMALMGNKTLKSVEEEGIGSE